MARKNERQRSPEEAARREKIRELLALSRVEGMEDIQQLFRETIADNYVSVNLESVREHM